MKVRKGGTYVFNANGWDTFHVCHQGLKNGDIVKVIHPHGCPAPNAMGQCHVEKDGQFMGMVSTGSLSKKS